MKLACVTAILLVICQIDASSLDREWWKHATIYEIYLKSFQDSDGDGLGDFKGVTSKLDYLVDIGVDTVWITPFYPSPMADGGYDITDFYGIDPIYGTMEDFEELMKEMKKRGLNFVLDLVINHSSDEHEWFQKSIHKIQPYTDYYVWADPKGYDEKGNPIPPNNWPSLFSFAKVSSCWTWNEKRNQFYLHQFTVKQPDFNLRNENLKKELKAIMKFWLGKGVAAFRLDGVAAFMEDPLLRDESINEKTGSVLIESSKALRYHHPDTLSFLRELYSFVGQYDRKHGKKRQSAIITEVYGSIHNTIQYYGTTKNPISHFPFNFQLTFLFKYLNAPQMIDHLNTWIKNIPKGAASNWILGSHDNGRVFNRFSTEYNYVLLTLVSMLPGVTGIYYGEEIGQPHNDIAPENYKEHSFDRERFRAPMQWDDTLNAGFTSGEKSWFPVHPSYWHTNVLAQKTQQNSTLNYFKALFSIRKTKISKYGDLKLYAISKWIFAFTRTYHKSEYVVVLNLGMESSLVDLHTNIKHLPSNLTVALASPNSGYSKGMKLKSTPHHPDLPILRPHSSLILTTK